MRSEKNIEAQEKQNCGKQIILLLTAVGGFIRSVHTVVVAVAHPDAGNAAFGDGALELGGCACDLSYREK